MEIIGKSLSTHKAVVLEYGESLIWYDGPILQAVTIPADGPIPAGLYLRYWCSSDDDEAYRRWMLFDVTEEALATAPFKPEELAKLIRGHKTVYLFDTEDDVTPENVTAASIDEVPDGYFPLIRLLDV